MHPQLSDAVAEVCQTIAANAGPAAIGFDGVAKVRAMLLTGDNA